MGVAFEGERVWGKVEGGDVCVCVGFVLAAALAIFFTLRRTLQL